MTEFAPWPKTPRLFRDMIITEKIDGTNGAIHIEKVDVWDGLPSKALVPSEDGSRYLVVAQSRKRLIDPQSDNFGFAAWVRENQEALVAVLGEGVHYGEWWGSGIQRGYDLPKGEKRFSLFNVNRWAEVEGHQDCPPALRTVPVLYEGTFDTEQVRYWLACLKQGGSKASLGFDRPEGVIVYHTAANSVFKALIENDDMPKGAS